MPREGIDYPGWFNRAACSIRCELSKLWSAVGTKLSKINTVEPDGDGKVNIVSDSATLTVTDDPGNNAVRLELDAGISNPPVDSVNGQTGTVVLNTTNVSGLASIYNGSSLVPSSGTVADLITLTSTGARNGDNALRTRMTAAETAISTEASDRATADNALAAQIATKAGIGDTVVKNPVAAQSIAGYDLEVQENLDVDGDLTVGGTTDTAVATGTTGTYNTKAANSQRIKNELDAYGPMARLANAQTFTGTNTFSAPIVGRTAYDRYFAAGSGGSLKWFKVCQFPSTMVRFDGRASVNNMLLMFTGSSTGIFTRTFSLNVTIQMRLTVETDSSFTLWMRLPYNFATVYCNDIKAYAFATQLDYVAVTETTRYDSPDDGSSHYDSTELTQ